MATIRGNSDNARVEVVSNDGLSEKLFAQANVLVATDGTPLPMNANGLVVQSALPVNTWDYAGVTGGITGTTDTAIKAAAGAGVRNYLRGIQFKNTAAVASEIVIKDGSTVIWRGHVSASMSFSDGWTFDPPLRGTANTALNVALITTGTATIISAQGYTGA